MTRKYAGGLLIDSATLLTQASDKVLMASQQPGLNYDEHIYWLKQAKHLSSLASLALTEGNEIAKGE